MEEVGRSSRVQQCIPTKYHLNHQQSTIIKCFAETHQTSVQVLAWLAKYEQREIDMSKDRVAHRVLILSTNSTQVEKPDEDTKAAQL